MAVTKETRPDHPFSDSIMSTPLPKGFELPRIQKYDGFSDPEDHLAMFNAHMLFYGATVTDPIMCRAFPCTLTKYALRWFASLPPNSINNFSQFTSKFLTNFALSKTYRKTSASLMNLKQRADESLEDYLYRFNQEAIQVDNLSPELYICLVLAGLQPGGDFLDSLLMKPPRNLDDLWQRATRYIDVEVRLSDHHSEEKTPRTRRGRNDGMGHSGCYNDTFTSSNGI